MNSTSPIDYLIAFGTAYIAGALSVIFLQQYKKFVASNAAAAAAQPKPA